MKPKRKMITKAQLFNLLDACFDAWAMDYDGLQARADDMEHEAFWREVCCPEWVREWINLNRLRRAA